MGMVSIDGAVGKPPKTPPMNSLTDEILTIASGCEFASGSDLKILDCQLPVYGWSQ
jgi:hypothetical protein